VGFKQMAETGPELAVAGGAPDLQQPTVAVRALAALLADPAR
jgi:hypothetical protein